MAATGAKLPAIHHIGKPRTVTTRTQGEQGVQEAAVPKEAIEVLGDSTKPISEPALGIVGIGDE
jgi:hypothetical protein